MSGGLPGAPPDGPWMRPRQTAEERRLLGLFRELAAGDRSALLAFAAFLAQGGASAVVGTGEPEPESRPPPAPRDIPRPPSETLVAAIKRLSATYDMLERERLLNETSALMSAHVLRGRPATEVIDDLEALFARHYREYRARQGFHD